MYGGRKHMSGIRERLRFGSRIDHQGRLMEGLEVKRQVAAVLVVGVLAWGSIAASASGDPRVRRGDPRIAWRGSAQSNGKASKSRSHRMPPAYVPGQVIVRFREGVPAIAQDRLTRSA